MLNIRSTYSITQAGNNQLNHSEMYNVDHICNIEKKASVNHLSTKYKTSEWLIVFFFSFFLFTHTFDA